MKNLRAPKVMGSIIKKKTNHQTLQRPIPKHSKITFYVAIIVQR